MKTWSGVVLGVIGYAAWKLSEPEAGQPADFAGRVQRLKEEFGKATEIGKAAGEQKQRQMEAEFDQIFKKR